MSPLLGRTDHAARTLPIASSSTVLAHTKVLMRDHRGPLAAVLAWHVVAALVALVGPWVIGQVVQEVTTGDRSLTRIDLLIGLLVAAILLQTGLTWVARKTSFVLS
jgi:ABC-type bacteriocin/lantibiotic exporter with double-glycine peptidase domain